MPPRNPPSPGPTAPVVLPQYRQFGARLGESGALHHVLAYRAQQAGSGEPPSEALLFGIGGGIGLGYFVYVSGDYTSLYLGTRLTGRRADFLTTTCERLGLTVEARAASGRAAFEKRLRQGLAAGRPVIVWVDPGALPYPAPPAAYHAVVVYGLDPERGLAHAAERSDRPLALTLDELAGAANAGEAPRFQTLEVGAEAGLKPAALKAAVRAGLRAGCDQMLNGFGPANFRHNFGLAALEKWAALLADARDPRGWARFFPPGPKLFEALAGLYGQIEHRGRGGSAHRELFADFLDEAAGLLNKPALGESAAEFRAAARLWHGLAEALLPGRVPLFKETKQLLTRRRRLFEKRGRAAQPEFEVIGARLAALRAEAHARFPLNEGEAAALRADLRDRVLQIHAAEEAAVRRLARLTR